MRRSSCALHHALLAAILLAERPDALTLKSLYPANGATGQCLDTPLRMVFSARPAMGWNGSIRIRDAATNSVVKTWTITSNPGDPQSADVTSAWTWQDSVGYTKRNVWPVVLDSVPGYLAEIRVPQHLLAADTKYQIEVDAGVLKGSDGSAFPGVDAGSWVFTTGAKPSPKATVTVAQDNSGDVCSIQGGLDLAPSGSSSTVQVLVRSGYYRETFAARNKNHLHLYGAGTDSTIVRYFNSNNLNDAGSSARNVAQLSGNGISIRALSIVNTVGVAGAQAEALYLQGDSQVVADVFLHSYQDTWLNTGGRVYVQDATIEGSVDFVWGYNPVFFKRCALVLNRTGGVVVQPRNDVGTHGYVFDSCTLRAHAAGYSGCHFARDGGSSFSYGEVMYLHTTIYGGSYLDAAPWTINATTDSSHLRFCEYQSRDSNGTLISISNAQRKRLQCSSDSAASHANLSKFFSGWTPSVPALAGVLALTRSSTTRIEPASGRETPDGPRARILPRAGSGSRLELLDPGDATVREILPDGSARKIFHGQAPCSVDWKSASGGLAWIEIVQPQGRTVLSTTGLRP